MDDNIHMEPCSLTSRFGGANDDPELIDNVSANGSNLSEPIHAWRPTHILDFSGLSVGELLRTYFLGLVLYFFPDG